MSIISALKRIYARDSIIQPLLQKQMVSFNSNLKLVIRKMNTEYLFNGFLWNSPIGRKSRKLLFSSLLETIFHRKWTITSLMKHISKILAKFSPWWIMKVYFCAKMSWFKVPALVHICLAHNIACEYETGPKWTSIYKVGRLSIVRAAALEPYGFSCFARGLYDL